MKRRSLLGMCFLLGLSVSAFEAAEQAIAGEPLPDASVVAYWARRPPKPPQAPTVSEVTLTGVINDVQPTGLTIKASKTSKSKNQKQWLVLAQSDTTAFTIHGTATLDYMRRGQIVEFSGQIVNNENGADKVKEEKVADKVAELTIVSRKGGASPAKKGGAKDHAINPGVGDRIEAPKEADLDATLTPSDDSDSKADNSGKAMAKHEAVAGKTKIVGRIERCDGKSLTVTRGQQTIHVDLADIPTINVELSDLKLVQDSKDSSKNRVEGKGASGHAVSILVSDLVGAKIVVQGTAAETKSKRQCMAKSIEVTLAKPLTSKKSTSSEAKKTMPEPRPGPAAGASEGR